MPCPVCKTTIEGGTEHRACIFQLFDENKIQTIEDWEALSTKPVTIVKGRIRARIPRESFTTCSDTQPNAD